MLICIAGKSGSGKSEFSKRLALKDKRFVHYDLDKICHGLYDKKDMKKKIVEVFGDTILTHEKIDREKLRYIVFNNCIKMKQLTDIVWEELLLYIDNEIAKKKDKLIILDAIKIDQVKYFDMSDIKILLDTPFEIRMNRVIARDHIDFDEFMEIDKNSPIYNNMNFNYVIVSEDIDTEIEKIYNAIVN